MSTLIRLQGDDETNRREIRNQLRQPLIIPENSSVALKFADADVIEEGQGTDNFTVNAMSITRVQGVGNSAVLPSTDVIELVDGIYTDASSFFEMVEGRFNGTPLDNGYATFFAYADGDGRSNIVSYSAPSVGSSSFTNGAYWNWSGENPNFTLSTNDIEYSSNSLRKLGVGALTTFDVTSNRVGGSTNGKFSFNVNVDQDGWDFLLNGTRNEGIALFTFGIALGTANYQVNGTDIGKAWSAATDKVTITYTSEEVTLKLEQAGQPDFIQTYGTNFAPTKDQFTIGHIQPAFRLYQNGSMSLTNVQGVYFADQHTALSGEIGVARNFKITFSNDQLRHYLGYQNLSYSSGSNPAILKSESPMNWKKNMTGVMVVLDGLGVLSSYDAGLQAVGGNNILDVVPTDALYRVRYINPSMVQLSINNQRELSVNTLTAYFINASNGERLAFRGKPTLVVVISPP